MTISAGYGRGAFLAAFISVAGLLLCACGGGGSQPAAAPAVPASPAAAPQMGQATVTITVPQEAIASIARHPAYVSASTQSISISSYAVVGGVIAAKASATTNQDLTSTAPGCSGTGPIVCSVTVAAPIGTDAFSVSAYQGTGEMGAVLSTLPKSAATQYTIVAGQANTVPLVLGGVPATIVVSPAQSALTGGVSANFGISVVASDAGGKVIIGNAPYANPITLTDSDGTGGTSLSTTSVTSPATAVTLAYNGNTVASTVTLGASASGATVTPGTLTFTFGFTVACSSGCSGLSNPNSAYTETISEGGYGSGSFTLAGSGSSCTFEPPTSVAASNGTATVSVFPNPLGGTCSLQVTDSFSHTATASLTFNAAGSPVVSSYPLPINGSYPTIPADANNGGLKFTVDCCPDSPPAAYPTLLWGAYTYWPLSYNTNPNDLGIVIYASPNDPVRVIDNLFGTRYIFSISVNTGLQTVTYSGQGGTTATTTFAQLVP